MLSRGLAAEGASMRWTVTLVAEIEPGQKIEHEIMAVDRGDRITPATLGLSIAEGKTVFGGDPGAGRRGSGQTPRHGRPALSVVRVFAVLQRPLPVDLSLGVRQRADAGAAV